jgi:hypothetical protein
MQSLNSLHWRRQLGAACVLLGMTLMCISFGNLLTGCAKRPAYANGGAESSTAADNPDNEESEKGAPLTPDDVSTETAEAKAELDKGLADSGIESQSEQDADAGSATTRVPGRRSRRPVIEQPQPPLKPEGRNAAAEVSDDQMTGEERTSADTSASAGANSGFAELEKGWPASSGVGPGTAELEQQLVANTPLSSEAREFAGRWTAAVINKDGGARLLASVDEWVFNLGLDARCTARQKLDGKYWEQSGWWQLQGETLTLSLGPGGVWVFAVQRELGDIAVWERAVEQTGGGKFTLFCVRSSADKMPPGLAPRYNSDFGPLRFEPSGPGHWRASYGDPLGKLTVTRLGNLLAGQWDQHPGMGFVIFKMDSGGSAGAAPKLEGVWWYSGSTTFDGRWTATQAK